MKDVEFSLLSEVAEIVQWQPIVEKVEGGALSPRYNGLSFKSSCCQCSAEVGQLPSYLDF